LFALPYTPVACPANPIIPTIENISRPILNIGLKHGSGQAVFGFACLVDSGADFCIFPAQFGYKAGIDVKAGKVFDTSGVGSVATAYYHEIAVGVVLPKQVIYFDCTAGFSFDMELTGVLGRRGFFEAFDCVTFRERQRLIELYLEK
jgi:hypothetical protein